MLIEQIIEFKLMRSGPPDCILYVAYSYNWLFSWQNKNL